MTGVTAATPNEPELEAAYGENRESDRAKLGDLGRRADGRFGAGVAGGDARKDGLAVFEAFRAGRGRRATFPSLVRTRRSTWRARATR